jgi:hypothetical protein
MAGPKKEAGMKKWLLGLVVLMAFVSMGTFAQAADRPIDLALFSPVELYPATDSVKGLRLAIYGVKENFTGLDLGLVKVTRGDFVGVGFWGGNKVGGNAKGLQAGFVNYVEKDFTGAQLGLLNYSFGETTGVQWGIYNRGGNFAGVQLGFVNRVTRLSGGLQIGLLNFWDEAASGDWKKERAFFPIVNWKF